jgi:hypothetical protein
MSFLYNFGMNKNFIGIGHAAEDSLLAIQPGNIPTPIFQVNPPYLSPEPVRGEQVDAVCV